MSLWSAEKESFLINNFCNRNIKVSDIAKQLGFTSLEVRNKANRLNLKRLSGKDIDAYIINNINKKTLTEIASNLDRSLCTIRRRGIKLGVINKTERIYVTTRKMDEIISRYPTCNTFILSAELDIPVHSIRKVVAKNSIRKVRDKKEKKKSSRSWKPCEEEFIKNNYRNMTNKDIAIKLSRDYNSVRGKVAHMGLTDNLKIFTKGNLSFKYNTEFEKNRKLNYINKYRELLFEREGFNEFR